MGKAHPIELRVRAELFARSGVVRCGIQSRSDWVGDRKSVV